MDKWSAAQPGLLKYAKLIIVAQKRPIRSKNTWDEVLVDDRKKLGMDSSYHQNRSGGEDNFEEVLSTKTNPRKTSFRIDMMMMHKLN